MELGSNLCLNDDWGRVPRIFICWIWMWLQRTVCTVWHILWNVVKTNLREKDQSDWLDWIYRKGDWSILVGLISDRNRTQLKTGTRDQSKIGTTSKSIHQISKFLNSLFKINQPKATVLIGSRIKMPLKWELNWAFHSPILVSERA